MRGTTTDRGVIATMLVVVVMTAALAILCPAVINLPMRRGMGGGCASMTHSGVYVTAASSEWSPRVASATVAPAIGLVAAYSLAPSRLHAVRGAAPPRPRVEPLGVRLLI